MFNHLSTDEIRCSATPEIPEAIEEGTVLRFFPVIRDEALSHPHQDS